MFKNILIVLLSCSTIILGVFFVDFLIFYWKPAETGVFGDTIGGLLAPVIGLLSILFIFISFKDQRSVPLYLEFSKKIEKLIGDCDNLDITHDSKHFRGKSAIRIYEEHMVRESFKKGNYWPKSHRDFFESMILILKRTNVFYTRLNAIKGAFSKAHLDDINHNLDLYYDSYLKEIIRICTWNQQGLYHLIRDNDPPKVFEELEIESLNEAIRAFTEFRSLMNSLIRINVLSSNDLIPKDAKFIWSEDLDIDDYLKLLPVVRYEYKGKGIRHDEIFIDNLLKKRINIFKEKYDKVISIIKE